MSLVNTRIQNARAKSNLDQWTNRPSQWGMLDKFLRDTNAPNSIITEDLKNKAWTSQGAPAFQTPVLDLNTNISVANTRTLTISTADNTSQLQALTFTTYTVNFTMEPAQYHNNEVDYQRDFSNKFDRAMRLLHDTLDTACVSAASTAKTQVFGDDLIYTNASDTLVATDAQRERIIGDVNALMGANDYYGPFDLVGNMGFYSLIGTLKEKGTYNEQNKTIQLMDKTLAYSNRISNAAGHAATFYTIQQGATGLLFRAEVEALYGRMLRTGHEWGITAAPLSGIPLGWYYYESAVDGSAQYGAASAHNTRIGREHYSFSVDVCYVTPYNQDLATYANPIMALAVAEA